MIPGQRQHILQDEVEGRHHLYRSPNTPRDPVRDLSEHLQTGELYVVALAGGARVDEPEVDQVAQAGDEGVEEQAESDHTEELPPSTLGSVVNIFIFIVLYLGCFLINIIPKSEELVSKVEHMCQQTDPTGVDKTYL